MKLSREIFDGGNDARSGAIHSITDDREVAIADGVEDLPTGKVRERFKIAGGGFRMRGRKDQIIGLQADDFFKIHLRPVLRGVHDAGGVGFAERIGDEGVFPDRNERAGPDDEKNAAGREGFEFGVQRGETGLKVGSEGLAGFGDTEEVGKFLRGGENFVNVMGVGGVGGNSQGVERTDGVEAIDLLGDKDEVGVERGDFFEIRIDGAAHFGFLLSVGRIVAEIGVADEAVLDAEGVEGFGQAGREGNNARRKLRDADGAAEFVNDFARGGRRGGCRRGRQRLGADGQGAEQECEYTENAGAQHGIGRTELHESPLTKVPREIGK